MVFTNKNFTKETKSRQGVFTERAQAQTGHFFESAPATLATANKQVIKLYHVPTNEIIEFPAFLTDFKDNYKTDYQKETVFGRMDPIATFKSIERTINIGFTVPAEDLNEARSNMLKVNKLISRLYPTYDDATPGNPGGATTIKGAPIFKLLFGNLIYDGGGGEHAAITSGLPGIINGFSYDPILEEGMFDPQDLASSEGQTTAQWRGDLYPQSIRVSFEFTVLHNKKLGWNDDGSWRGGNAAKDNFPYKVRANTPYDTPSGYNPLGGDLWYGGIGVQHLGDDLTADGRGAWRDSAECTPLSELDECMTPPPTFTYQTIDTWFNALADDIEQAMADNPNSQYTEEQVARLRRLAAQSPDGVRARADVWGDTMYERGITWFDLQTDLLKARMEIRIKRMLGPTGRFLLGQFDQSDTGDYSGTNEWF